MSSFGSSERQLLDLIDLIYGAVADGRLWGEALAAFSEATGGVGATMVMLGDGHSMVGAASPSLEEGVLPYASYWGRHDIIGAHAMKARLRGVQSDIDVIDRSVIDRNPFYQEFRRSLGIRHLQSVIAATPEGERLSFSVHYGLAVTEIDPAQKAFFEQIARHLQRAGVMLLRTGGVGVAGAGLAEVLGRLGYGAAAIDPRLQIVLANAAFARHFAGHGTTAAGRLVFRSSALQARYETMAAAAFDPVRLRPEADFLALIRTGRSLPLFLRVLPFPSATAGGERLALVMITDPAERDDAKVTAALIEAGLTPGEARLAELVGAGLSPGDAADQLGIAVETARTVLKKVFAKLEISRQTELVRLVDRIKALFKA